MSGAIGKPPWNSTEFVTHFNASGKPDAAAIRTALKGVIRKYVFFAEDANVRYNYKETRRVCLHSYINQLFLFTERL